jgi:SnoaL-like domain
LVAFGIEELAITAGEGVAFTVAIVRCGSGAFNGPPEEGGFLFRLTIGLRNIYGDWRIAHEHHSVPSADPRGPTNFFSGQATSGSGGTFGRKLFSDRPLCATSSRSRVRAPACGPSRFKTSCAPSVKPLNELVPQKPFRSDIPALNIETSERAARAGIGYAPKGMMKGYVSLPTGELTG